MKKAAIPILFTTLFQLLAPMQTQAQPQATRPEYTPGEVLVKFKLTVPKKAVESQHAKLGAQVIGYFDLIGVDHVKLPAKKIVAAAVAEYQALPEVEYADPNYYR